MPITKRTITTYTNEEGFDFTFEPIDGTLKITETKDGYTAKYLTTENDPIDPREDDNIGNMICFHRNYCLGDKQDEISKDSFNSWEELETYLIKEKNAVVVLPLYLYDHSGISIRTCVHGQHSSWDCGQVGFIYATKKQLITEGITKNQLQKHLIGEVETYNSYISGDVYCTVRETYTKEKEKIDFDSVGNYIGYKYAVDALETDI